MSKIPRIRFYALVLLFLVVQGGLASAFSGKIKLNQIETSASRIGTNTVASSRYDQELGAFANTTLAVYIGAHPDDIDIGMSGSLYKHAVGKQPILFMVVTDGASDPEGTYAGSVSNGWINPDGKRGVLWKTPDGATIFRDFYSVDLASKRCGGYFSGTAWVLDNSSHNSQYGLESGWMTRIHNAIPSAETVQLSYPNPENASQRLLYPDSSLGTYLGYTESIARAIAYEINHAVMMNGYRRDLVCLNAHAPEEVCNNYYDTPEHSDHFVTGNAARLAINYLHSAYGFGNISATWFTIYRPIEAKAGFSIYADDISQYKTEKVNLCKACWESFGMTNFQYSGWTYYPTDPEDFEHVIQSGYLPSTESRGLFGSASVTVQVLDFDEIPLPRAKVTIFSEDWYVRYPNYGWPDPLFFTTDLNGRINVDLVTGNFTIFAGGSENYRTPGQGFLVYTHVNLYGDSFVTLRPDSTLTLNFNDVNNSSLDGEIRAVANRYAPLLPLLPVGLTNDGQIVIHVSGNNEYCVSLVKAPSINSPGYVTFNSDISAGEEVSINVTAETYGKITARFLNGDLTSTSGSLRMVHYGMAIDSFAIFSEMDDGSILYVTPGKMWIKLTVNDQDWWYEFFGNEYELREGGQITCAAGGPFTAKINTMQYDTDWQQDQANPQIWLIANDSFGNVLSQYHDPLGNTGASIDLTKDGSSFLSERFSQPYLRDTTDGVSLMLRMENAFVNGDAIGYEVIFDAGPHGNFHFEGSLFSNETLLKFEEISTEHVMVRGPAEFHLKFLKVTEWLEAAYQSMSALMNETLTKKVIAEFDIYGGFFTVGDNRLWFHIYDVMEDHYSPGQVAPCQIAMGGGLLHELAHVFQSTPSNFPENGVYYDPWWFGEPFASMMAADSLGNALDETSRRYAFGERTSLFLDCFVSVPYSEDIEGFVQNAQHAIYCYLKSKYGMSIHQQMVREWADKEFDSKTRSLEVAGFDQNETYVILYSYLANENLAWLYQIGGLEISEQRVSQGLRLLSFSHNPSIHNLQTGLNYTTIQAAIDALATSDGQTIFVNEGIYNENICIYKSLSLVGKKMDKTTITGGGCNVKIFANNVTIEGFTVSNGSIGICVSNCGGSVVRGNTIIANSLGILLDSATDSDISGNSITDNKGHGIWLQKSSENTIRKNSITSNSNDGIKMDLSTNNVIFENTIANNKPKAITSYSCSGNSIYHNNIIGISGLVHDENSTNFWDDGYPNGGNYWSDYNGTDVYSGVCQNDTGFDWIGDSPNKFDRYPLMHPYNHRTQDIEVGYRDLLARFNRANSQLENLNSTIPSFVQQIDNLNSTCKMLQDAIANLTSSLNSTGKNAQEQINLLNQKIVSLEDRIDSLNSTLLTSVDNMQKQNDATNVQLNDVLDVLHILTVLTIILIGTTIYFALRKPKAKSDAQRTRASALDGGFLARGAHLSKLGQIDQNGFRF